MSIRGSAGAVRGRTGLLILAATGSALALMRLDPGTPVPYVAAGTAMQAAAPDQASATQAEQFPAGTTAYAALPEPTSWQGTQVAGGIDIDAAGNIIPDASLHAMFDYLRSAEGDLTPAQVRQRLDAIAHDRGLGTAQVAQLNRLFSIYTNYLKAAAEIHPQTSDVADLRQVFDARHWLRRDMLGIVMADGFFAASEAHDRYQIERLEAFQDKTLDPAQRAQRLAELETQEPPEVRAAQQPTETLEDLQSRTEALHNSGAGDDQIQALREQTLGPEAAARLQALDQSNAAWSQRMSALEETQQQILADSGIADADRQQRIDDYINNNFSGPEALRARALLGLTNQPAPARKVSGG